MKKAISLLLSLVMLLSVTAGLSFNAFAGEITEVNITLPSTLIPVAGTTANQYDTDAITASATGELFGTYSYTSNSAVYQVKNGNTWNSVSPSDTFAIGKTYRIRLSCKSSLQNNDLHSQNLVCKINGLALTKETEEIDSTNNFFYINNTRTTLTAFYYFGTLEAKISSVTITGAPDVDLGNDVVVNPYAYKIDDSLTFTNIAIEAQDGTTWKTATKYECETKYRFVIDVSANDGYTLNNNFTATIKTATANRYSNKTVVTNNGKNGTIYCEFPNALASHSYGAGVETTPTSCAAEGVMSYTCTKCGKVKTEPIAKLDHKYEKTVTKATTKANGAVENKCTVCGNVESSAVIAYPKTVTLSKTKYTYDGKAKKPSVTVKDADGKTIAASNYTVSYAKGRKEVGSYAVKVTFKGNYTGTKTVNFTVVPKGTSLTKVTAGKKSFTANWKKQTSKTTGYQVQYSTSKWFAGSNKTVTIKKNKTTKTTVKKLAGKKAYYVRVRTYKTVNGKKYYSDWSKSKSVKTKK